jgi:nitroreductase
MDVREAIASRYSCRAFLSNPVPEKIIREIVEQAARAPSAGNMQPWRVDALAGERIEALIALLLPRMATDLPKGEGTDYAIYPHPLTEPYYARRFSVGELLYKSIGISREDRAGRYRQYARNFQFSARQLPCSSRAKSLTVRRNGPTSAAICKQFVCWRATTVFTPARNRLGSLLTRPFALFSTYQTT